MLLDVLPCDSVLDTDLDGLERVEKGLVANKLGSSIQEDLEVELKKVLHCVRLQVLHEVLLCLVSGYHTLNSISIFK